MSYTVDVIVIGAGQAGLAIGYYLNKQQRRFIIFDGSPAAGHTWRTRYDSLRLFTPARYNNLPELPFPGPLNAYPAKDDVAGYLERYIETFQLPVRFGERVQGVRPYTNTYSVETNLATYVAQQIVVATGPFQRPYVPLISAALAPEVYQIHSTAYRNPQQLPHGSVLVVGAGNSGAQIAEELAATRHVTLAIGKRVPSLPQQFLGKDLFWWLHRLGIMDVTIDTWIGRRMRRLEPLIGTDIHRLSRQRGVRLVGRVVQASGNAVICQDGQRIESSTIIWATGFRPEYGWIQASIFDKDGAPIHRRGVTAAPGLYFLGLPWMYRRGSALLGGVGRDAAFLAERIASYAAQQGSTQAVEGGASQVSVV